MVDSNSGFGGLSRRNVEVHIIIIKELEDKIEIRTNFLLSILCGNLTLRIVFVKLILIFSHLENDGAETIQSGILLGDDKLDKQ